jgi:hypothetical protein
VCENHKRRSTRYFLEALSDKSSQFFLQESDSHSKKNACNYIYTLKESQPAKWPSSIEKITFLEDVVTKVKVLWSGYQTMNCDPTILYFQSHMFFKWLFFLQQKTEENFYIQEKVPATVASKSYVYRKLKELPFIAILNRKSIKSLQEQVLICINSNVPLVLTKKLTELECHLPVLLNFVKTVQARIKDGTFKSLKYTDQRGYRFFSLLPLYSFTLKSLQIDTQAF